MLKLTPVFLLFFVLCAQAREIDRTAVLVNGDVILQSDVGAFKKNFALRREIDPFIPLMAYSPNAAKDADAMNYLVQERLVQQKYPPTEDEIEEEINAVQRNNHIDRDHLKEVLKSQGVKFEDYRRLMGVSVSKRKLIEKDLRPLAAISDEDVRNFYYTDSVFANRRKTQKLVLSYTLQQMLLPTEAMAQTAQKRLHAGEDFDSVAAELSSRGVETSRLASMSEENINPKIREAIQGMHVGESTRTIVAGDTRMILRILEIGAPQDPVFEKEKETIRNELFQKALVNQLKLWTERERASSYVHVST
ncbi:MAG: peptidyl-prolyl cis-trans isomerase [Bdellovibrionota bacterium]